MIDTGIYFPYLGYTLFSLKWGTGKRILLAFHGFGQHAEVFHLLDDALKDQFTVYSIEHFHHGRSTYPAGIDKSVALNQDFYFELLQAFCKSQSINTYSLIGYSLGGKTALGFLQKNPEKVEALLLFAPDGVIESGWYKFVSRNRLGEFLYKRIIQRPTFFFFVLSLFNRLGLLNQKIFTFVKRQLSTSGKRRLVFNTWRTYSNIRLNLPFIKDEINKKNIPARIFTGRFDTVLNPGIGKLFIQGLHSNCKHIVLEAGHDLIRTKTVTFLKNEIAELF